MTQYLVVLETVGGQILVFKLKSTSKANILAICEGLEPVYAANNIKIIIPRSAEDNHYIFNLTDAVTLDNFRAQVMEERENARCVHSGTSWRDLRRFIDNLFGTGDRK